MLRREVPREEEKEGECFAWHGSGGLEGVLCAVLSSHTFYTHIFFRNLFSRLVHVKCTQWILYEPNGPHVIISKVYLLCTVSRECMCVSACKCVCVCVCVRWGAVVSAGVYC